GAADDRDRDRHRWGEALSPDDRREPEGGEARHARRAHVPEDARGGRYAELLLEVHAGSLTDSAVHNRPVISPSPWTFILGPCDMHCSTPSPQRSRSPR